jgi:hypothetical protein
MQKYIFRSHNFESIQLPQITERRGHDYVDFGSNNLYPELLIELYNNSAMHHTCIDAKTDAITGDGIKNFGSTPMNTKGDTLDELFERIAKDFMIFGGYAINVIWNKAGDGIAEMYHVDFNRVRSGKMNEDDIIEEYFYSADWSQSRKYKPVAYKSFDATDNKGDNASQIFYYFDYTVGNSYYPLPSYVGAINDVDIDSRVSKFHANNLKNGLAPSMMLTFRNGLPGQEEQNEIYRDIDRTFAGEENAGKFFINFSEPGREPQVQTIENANSDYYVTLEGRITSRILTSHRITSPKLLGLYDASGFSNNADEIQTAFNHFLGTVIIPEQKKLLKSLQKLVWYFGMTVKLEVDQSDILYTETIETTQTQITDITE